MKEFVGTAMALVGLSAAGTAVGVEGVARGDFINGVENFNGNALDASTWLANYAAPVTCRMGN